MAYLPRTLGALALSICLLSTASAGTLIQTIGPITNLRIEGSAGFIGLPQETPCSNRVWVDMNTALGRSIYATAMMAFVIKQPAVVRAYDDSERVFGACRLYDIYVPQ